MGESSLHSKCGRQAWVEYRWVENPYTQHVFPGLLCVPWPKYALILFSQFTLITYSSLFLVSVCFFGNCNIYVQLLFRSLYK